MIVQAPLLRTVLAAAIIGTGYALPGASSSPGITSTPVSNAATSAASTTQSNSSPTETIIIAALGEDEQKGDLKSKWQTYWVTGEPDWCKPDSSKLIKDPDVYEHIQPPTLFYGDGDPDRMNGCSYDKDAHTWGCDGWSASCRVVISADGLTNGKVVDTCDGLEVLQLITCVKDASSTTATQTIKAPATSTGSNAAYTSSCNEMNMTKELWDAEGMHDFVWDMAELIPSDHDGNFIDYLNSKITGENQFECDLVKTGNNFQCTDTGGSCREGDNARYYFMKTSINHFFKWLNTILDAIESAQREFGSNSLSITDKFIKTDLPPSDDMWIATMFAGLLGCFGGILGAAAATLPALAKEASSAAKLGENYGLAAGLTGAGSGIATDTNALVSSMLETADGVIQNRLNTLSSLQDYISNSMDTSRDALVDWASAALYNPANNSDGTEYLRTGPNLAKIIANGDFADDRLDKGQGVAIDESIVKGMYSSAIGYLWHTQNIYIVKLSAELPVDEKMIYNYRQVNKTVCDVDDTWFGQKAGIVRACDGDTAYFFIKRAPEKEQEIYGADDDLLGDYGLSLVKIAKAAEKTQENYGYIQNMNVEGNHNNVMEKLQTNPFEKSLFVGMNFCDLDAIEDFWRPHEEDWSYLNNIKAEIKVIAANSCPQQKLTIDGEDQDWPTSGTYFRDPPNWSSKY